MGTRPTGSTPSSSDPLEPVRLSHDPLTGLAGHELWVEHATHALSRATRLDWVTGVFVVDIDDFSDVNGTFGHRAGDQVLIEVADRLVKHFRGSDTVGRPWESVEEPLDGVARFGADRFVIVCENIAGADAALSLAERIARSATAPVALDDGTEITLTVGIGAAIGGPAGPGIGERILEAEAALRTAKGRGQAQCELRSDAAVPTRRGRAAEKQALRRALEQGEFRLHYQPKTSLESGRIVGAEALLRWEDPERGVVPPLEFVPLAEEVGLIVPIGKWVIEEACRQAARWRRRFPRPPSIVVSVNVSGRQFGPELVDTVAETLRTTRTEPAQLCLEVTESILIGDADAAISTLRDIAALGVKLSLDDFGTGYSSLSYLKRFPLHELKIDRSFVDGLGSNDDDTAIVAATVAMAHALGLSVVAEGVETADQLERLRVLGCQEVQGYLISPPMPTDDFERLMSEETSPTSGSFPGGAPRRSEDTYRPERVLVVDDAASVRQMTQMTLSAVGFDVYEAEDGASALTAARRLRPDCVILDVSLPDMSGVDVCRALRADPLTAACTIVMLTKSADPANKVEAFTAGADDYMVKPFSPRDLAGRVHAALRRRNDTAQTEAEGRHVADRRDRARGVQDEAASERDMVAGERDAGAQVRDRGAARRDEAGDQRDEAAGERDRISDVRDEVGQRRDQVAHQRDDAGEQRDRARDRRDEASDRRDEGGDARDQAGDERDRAADERDRAAEQRERRGHDGQRPGSLGPSARTRQEAASDREQASRDRRAAAAERSHAESDRGMAGSDRAKGATERTLAEADRDRAASDRGEGAEERSQAQADRDTSAADRGVGAAGRSSAEALEEALRRATTEADRANRAKGEFLATMSHEIRTPLNAVIGMTGLLLETELSAIQREYADMVRSQGRALLAVVNDILDFSKIEAGKVELERIDFELATVAEEALDLVAVPAHAKGLELTALIAPDVPFWVRGDPGRIRQVLINLLSNAVKFTPEGEVNVDVRLVGVAGDLVDVRIEVADTGIGVTADQGDRLFESFAQADASTTRRFGGTGLGLAISKHLAELLDGEIGVRSNPGGGSTFWFTARLGRAELAAPAPFDFATETGPVRVLVVDDNATNRTVLDLTLRSWGMRPTCLGDGRTALAEMLTAAGSGQPFDVAILDHHMPGMDGLQLADAIRDDHRLRATPLVLLTTPLKRGDTEQVRQADVEALLPKPVHRSSLFACLATVLDAPHDSTGDRTAAAEVEDAVATAHVLVVEDNVANQMVAARTLENMGYRVDVAANGLEALDAMARVPYAAILMDCQMPEMDGYETSRQIRRREGAARRTPIIAMTAAVSAGDQARCLEAGMDDHVSKPFQPLELRRLLERLISDPGHPTATSGAGSSILDPAALGALHALAKGDPGRVATMVRQFLADTQSGLDTLRATPGNADLVVRTAHTLSGSCATFAATGMAALCSELLDAADTTGRPVTDATMDRLDEEYRRVATALGVAFRL